MELYEAIGYWVAQFVGGILGALALWAVFSGSDQYRVWLFIVAPLLGGIAAALVWVLLIAERPTEVAAGQVEPSDITVG